MGKLKMQTANKVDENYRKLAELFPNAVTETIDENGKVVRAIDKDVLMQEIAVKVVDGREERYQFTWPDKKKSVLLANAPINKTLRPCREESVDFDNTENLYIEGDNLEVLKLLQETYLEAFDLIYIDPPYNTGNDILYANDYSDSKEAYEEKYETDANGFRMFTNSDANGRYHTNWLNMIVQRIRLAKDVLKETGFFLVAIDHNELFNLGQVCDEVCRLQAYRRLHWQRRLYDWTSLWDLSLHFYGHRFDPLSLYIILPLCIAYATSRKTVISKTLSCIPAV